MIDKIKYEINMLIKKQALKNAKKRSLQRQKPVIFSELSNDEQEILIGEEIKKIEDDIQKKSLKLTLGYIGLDFIFG